MQYDDTTSQISAPLKKRNKMLTLSGTNGASSPLLDEEVAAAALAGLNQTREGSPTSSQSNGEESESEESVSSCGSMPKAVHKPPVNDTMVNHTYTDYSVVDESLLAFLQADEDHDNDSEFTEDEKQTKEKALKRIKKIFGDIAPTRKNSGGVVKPFPEKLMEVLDRGDMDSIITWLPHGRAFIVRHSQKLKEVVLPRFFKQSKFMSFTRQLNLWGFKRITKGTDAGAYYHELFLRGRPLLSTLMRRQKIKGTGIKLTPNPDTEPNFYKISEKRPLPASSTEKELEPLPPISTSISTSKSTASNSPGSNVYNNNATIDMLLNQQRLEQNRLQGLRQSQVALDRIGGGGLSGLSSRQSAFQESLALHMLQREAHHMPMQRLSTPTTAADFNLVAGSIQKKFNEQNAIASAQQLLNEVSSHTAVTSNPVEDMKQKLLNAVHTLEQAQSSAPPAPQSMTQNLMGHGLGQAQGLPPLSSLYSSNAFSRVNNHMPPLQQQAFLGQAAFGTQQQAGPSRGSMEALMTALDQTRQVAAAAQAQSSLLQQVANDLALGRHSKK